MGCVGTRVMRARRFPGWVALALMLPAAAGGAVRVQPAQPRLAAATEMRLPPETIYKNTVGPDSAVRFSHETHVPLADSKCTGCHPWPYPMLTRGPAPKHADMNKGGTCGMCHDGRAAFGIRDSSACLTCHAGVPQRPEAADAAAAAGVVAPAGRVPAPHAYPSGDGSPGKVTFRHQTHMRGASTCAACHPKLFKMAPAPPRPGGGMHEKSACGGCHDGSKAFGAEDSDACTRCHRETGARP
jgi:c(7)-type cytochrome triheme protein